MVMPDYRGKHGAYFRGSALSGTGSSRSEVEMSESGSSLSSGSGSDNDLAALRDPGRLTFQLLVDPHEVYPLLDLYDPLIGWIDPDLRLFHAGEGRGAESTCLNVNEAVKANGARKGILVNRHCSSGQHHRTLSSLQNAGGQGGGGGGGDVHVHHQQPRHRTSDSAEGCPPFSVVLFLYEEEACSGGRVDRVRRCLERSPWRLHHCEKASRRNLNLNPKSLDYFFISEDLPLWSVRQVHYGKEHIRLVVQARGETWADMVQFYKLILGFEPDFLRDDFCLFTVHSQINFDIQLALKRGPRTSVPQSARLHFKVADLGRLVPLFPNVCQPVSDCCWLTTDHDGNEVLLDVTGYCPGAASSSSSSSSSSSASDRGSSESCASASSSDVSFDSHDSGQSQDSAFSRDSGFGQGGGCGDRRADQVRGREGVDRGREGKGSRGPTSSSPAPRSTLDTFKRSKSLPGIIISSRTTTAGSGGGGNGDDKRKSQRRVTFCLDDVPPPRPPPPPPPPPPRLTPVAPPCVPPFPPPPFPPASSPLETRFPLRFDTCPTAPLSTNNTREEQIGFYV
ncbi:uncharacterized protein LOC143275558 isoform X2 [Babylonia areolata]|uniref:uncharacterized protein LOC143275558 isoform X2 n=1 Tax=Babylonia areolata TaxID=304850 RepID=UPI003FD315D4